MAHSSSSSSLLVLLLSVLLLACSAQPAAPVLKKGVRDAANAKVAAVRADIAPCADLSAVEKVLPTCDLTDPATRDSIECRTLLKGAGSKELGTEIEVGRIRGSRYLLPANATAGRLVKMGGQGHGSLFESTVAPTDFNKPVAFTVRTFHGAAPLGQRINMTIKDHSFEGVAANAPGFVVALTTEQCDEAKVQPGSRVVCGVCLLKTDNVKEITLSADASNKEVVSLPLKDGDTELGAIVSGAVSVRAASGAIVAAAALVAALL